MSLNQNEFDLLFEIKEDIGEIKGNINGINTRMDDTLINCVICKKDLKVLQNHRTVVVTLSGAALIVAGFAVTIAAGML